MLLNKKQKHVEEKIQSLNQSNEWIKLIRGNQRNKISPFGNIGEEQTTRPILRTHRRAMTPCWGGRETEKANWNRKAIGCPFWPWRPWNLGRINRILGHLNLVLLPSEMYQGVDFFLQDEILGDLSKVKNTRDSVWSCQFDPGLLLTFSN